MCIRDRGNDGGLCVSRDAVIFKGVCSGGVIENDRVAGRCFPQSQWGLSTSGMRPCLREPWLSPIVLMSGGSHVLTFSPSS